MFVIKYVYKTCAFTRCLYTYKYNVLLYFITMWHAHTGVLNIYLEQNFHLFWVVSALTFRRYLDIVYTYLLHVSIYNRIALSFRIRYPYAESKRDDKNTYAERLETSTNTKNKIWCVIKMVFYFFRKRASNTVYTYIVRINRQVCKNRDARAKSYSDGDLWRLAKLIDTCLMRSVDIQYCCTYTDTR